MGNRRRRKSIVPTVRTIKEAKKESSQSQVRSQRKESLSDWEDRVRKQGIQRAEALLKEGCKLDVMILAPTEVRGGDTVPLAGVITKPDWKTVAKHELADLATEFISKAYLIGMLDNALPTILKSVIEEKGIYEYNIGEFFLLYGRFQEKYGVFTGEKTRKEMSRLVDGEEGYLKAYLDRGKPQEYPLPFAVRNILAHPKNRGNTLDSEGNDIRNSIEILKKWIGTS